MTPSATRRSVCSGEYVEWAVDGIRAEFGVELDAKAILDHDRTTLDTYLPPAGRALVAWADDHAVGVVCLRELSAECGEVKRMYVRPEQRGAGIGRALLEVLIDEARRIGYRQVRLDSPRFMLAAHGLYRWTGFMPFEPYPESEIPAEHHRHWVFMEKNLEGMTPPDTRRSRVSGGVSSSRPDRLRRPQL